MICVLVFIKRVNDGKRGILIVQRKILKTLFNAKCLFQ